MTIFDIRVVMSTYEFPSPFIALSPAFHHASISGLLA
jgi:hypothetical protein